MIPTSSVYRSQTSTEPSYTPPVSAVDKIKEIHAPLSRKDSSDSDLIFGGKDAEFYRSKYAYSTYTSTNKSSDMDVIFSASIDKRSSIESTADTSTRTNTNSFSGSRDSDYNTNTSTPSYRNPSSYKGIQNPMFQDFDSGKKFNNDDEDEYDLK